MFLQKPESHLLTAAQQAAAQFGCQPETLTFIQHSENVTFRVLLASGQPALLRLHIPLVPEFGDHGQHIEMIRSELAWLTALQAEGLPVPCPLGEVLSLEVPGYGAAYATLLTWIEGEIFNGSLRYHQVQGMAELVGKIHAHGLRWARPANFTRPRFDLARYRQALASIAAMQSDGRLTTANFYPLQIVIDRLEDLLTTTPLPKGLLHGDLYRGNFLWQGDQPALIDFSMCAEGPLLYDLAACLEHVSQKHHATFWEAYKKHVPIADEHVQLLPIFYVANGLVSLAIWVNHPPSQEALIQRLGTLSRAAAEYLRRW